MITLYGVLKPDVPRAGYNEECYELWRQEKRETERDFFDPYEGRTRIIHDPWWRERIWSVQCINDALSPKTFNPRLPAHYFWVCVAALWLTGQFGFTVFAFVTSEAFFGVASIVLSFGAFMLWDQHRRNPLGI